MAMKALVNARRYGSISADNILNSVMIHHLLQQPHTE